MNEMYVCFHFPINEKAQIIINFEPLLLGDLMHIQLTQNMTLPYKKGHIGLILINESNIYSYLFLSMLDITRI